MDSLPKNSILRLSLALGISLTAGGCSLFAPDPQPYWDGRGAGAAWHGFHHQAPAGAGEGDDSVRPPRPPSECTNCGGNGWLGDGRPRSDCPKCDRNGDGSNDDPLPAGDPQPSEPISYGRDQFAAAVAEAKASGKRILLELSAPEPFAGLEEEQDLATRFVHLVVAAKAPWTETQTAAEFWLPVVEVKQATVLLVVHPDKMTCTPLARVEDLK